MKKSISQIKIMTVEEMISVKQAWKNYLTKAQSLHEMVKNIEETKENRWELLSLEKSYSYFVDQIRKIKNVYSILIRFAEQKDLNKEEFIVVMKTLQLANNDLKVEYNKKLFKELNAKYVEPLMQENNVNQI